MGLLRDICLVRIKDNVWWENSLELHIIRKKKLYSEMGMAFSLKSIYGIWRCVFSQMLTKYGWHEYVFVIWYENTKENKYPFSYLR